MIRPTRSPGGYILVEAAVALVLLSVGSMTIQRTIQEAIRTRGQAQDFTHARFLLTQVVSELELQPQLVESSSQGQFDDEFSRFPWTYEVRRVNFPMPTAPLQPPPKGSGQNQGIQFIRGQNYLAQVIATVSWTRSGTEFTESYETLLGPAKLWQPPGVAPR